MIYGKQSNRGKILKYFQKTIFAGIYFMSFTFDQSKNEIARLVKHFSTNQVAFLAQGYKEAQARQEFIDPLFIALNWDVHNQQQTAPEYREVIVEDSLEMAGHEARKAPDYVFRIGRERKFFAEAKKPGVDLKTAAGPAYQLRRYAWSAKLPLSVLTDFQEWVAYDCRIRPSEGDKTSTARLAYMTYEEYADRWREIWDVFSREAVWGGSFDQFAQGGKGKRGTSEVDAEFLKEIESWRDSLAHNIALRNPDLTLEEMNDAVQRTIDRIIFLRMGEARGMEEYGQLQRIADRENIYAGLLALSKKADAKYNSGLFDFSKAGDQVTPRLLVDDKTLKPILADLYYPQSPYEFSVLPVEILGNVYEQFLGKVIHLTESHHAKVEEKPEVKKGGGVYYTPSSIVEYIVKNTVGKQVEGKSPAELLGFRVLDPACGSGSFLLGAYTYLLDYYRNWYSTHEPGKNKKSVTQQADGSWQLTLPERKRILIENIFGVDIDHQAVEVTKLSLLLKVLEGVRQLTLFTERALPNLDDNIKCGNSLIGTDYFDLQLKPDDKELRRVNPFDWKQGFPEVIKTGGFDCVIGNPPWGASFEKGEETFFHNKYKVADSSGVESYSLFIEKACCCLKNKGVLGFITPDTFLRKDDFLATRRFLLTEMTIKQLVETGPLFSQVRDTWCLVLVVKNEIPSRQSLIQHCKLSRFIVSTEERLSLFSKGEWITESQMLQSVWASRPKMIIGYRANEEEQRIIAKMEKSPILGDQGDNYKISRGEEGSKFALKEFASGTFFMVIPENIERYSVDEGIRIASTILTPTKVDTLYCHPKIWIIRIQKMRWKRRIVCAFDNRANSAGMKTLQIVVSVKDDILALKYLSAILSSQLLNFWCENYLTDDLNQSYLEKIPIPFGNISNPNDHSCLEKVGTLVEQMLDIHKHKEEAKDAREQERLKRVIDAIDEQIDTLVYELYGLTQEEIAIVEKTK